MLIFGNFPSGLFFFFYGFVFSKWLRTHCMCSYLLPFLLNLFIHVRVYIHIKVVSVHHSYQLLSISKVMWSHGIWSLPRRPVEEGASSFPPLPQVYKHQSFLFYFRRSLKSQIEGEGPCVWPWVLVLPLWCNLQHLNLTPQFSVYLLNKQLQGHLLIHSSHIWVLTLNQRFIRKAQLLRSSRYERGVKVTRD